MPHETRDTVAEYREKTRQLRAQAESMTTPKGVSMVLRLADEWEQKADALELELRTKRTPHGEKRVG